MLESGVPSQDFIRQAAETRKGKKTKRDLHQKWEIPDSDMDAVLRWLLMTAETYPGIGPDSDGLLNFCDSSSSKDVATDPAEAGAAATAAAGTAATATPSSGSNGFAVICLHMGSSSVNNTDHDKADQGQMLRQNFWFLVASCQGICLSV